MKKILLAVFVLSLIASSRLSAQGIVLANIPFVDTTNMNTIIPINDSLYNTDLVNPDTVNQLEVKITVNGFPVTDLVTVTGPIIFAPGQTIIIGGNSINVTNVAFVYGDNVVVIWPVADGVNGPFVIDTVHVLLPNGIQESSLDNIVSIFSLSKNQFQIHNLTSTSIAESNIYDLSGKLMMKNEGDKKDLLLNDFSSGIYMLEVKLADGKRAMFKLLVQ